MIVNNFAKGDRVILKPEYAGKWSGVIWVVEKFLTKNYQLSPAHNPAGRRLRAKPHMLVPVPTHDNDNVTEDIAVKPVPLHAPLYVGQIVRVTPNVDSKFSYQEPTNTLYVVMRDKISTVSIVRLGGDEGKYWPSVPRSWLSVVKIAGVTLV